MKATKVPEAVQLQVGANKESQMLLGKQIETFVINANAELTFENFRNLRATMLCPKIYRKSEFIKGKPGQVGSVQYQEFMDRSRSYEIRITGVNEYKRTLNLETIDYREPYSHTCHCPHPHHVQGGVETHEHSQAKKRFITIKVKELTNPLAEDGTTDAPERCIVTWKHHVSNDAHDTQEQLRGIEAYKKAVIRALQQGTTEAAAISSEGM